MFTEAQRRAMWAKRSRGPAHSYLPNPKFRGRAVPFRGHGGKAKRNRAIAAGVGLGALGTAGVAGMTYGRKVAAGRLVFGVPESVGEDYRGKRFTFFSSKIPAGESESRLIRLIQSFSLGGKRSSVLQGLGVEKENIRPGKFIFVRDKLKRVKDQAMMKFGGEKHLVDTDTKKSTRWYHRAVPIDTELKKKAQSKIGDKLSNRSIFDIFGKGRIHRVVDDIAWNAEEAAARGVKKGMDPILRRVNRQTAKQAGRLQVGARFLDRKTARGARAVGRYLRKKIISKAAGRALLKTVKKTTITGGVRILR